MLDRRQDLPEEAFIDVEELKRIEAAANWRLSDPTFMARLWADAVRGRGGFLLRLPQIYLYHMNHQSSRKGAGAPDLRSSVSYAGSLAFKFDIMASLS